MSDHGDHTDPRLADPIGERGLPGEVIDSPANMPGDQPIDEERPNKTDLESEPEAGSDN